ncbi:hypothetical protein D3C86_895390 [compost metagenome]
MASAEGAPRPNRLIGTQPELASVKVTRQTGLPEIGSMTLSTDLANSAFSRKPGVSMLFWNSPWL